MACTKSATARKLPRCLWSRMILATKRSPIFIPLAMVGVKGTWMDTQRCGQPLLELWVRVGPIVIDDHGQLDIIAPGPVGGLRFAKPSDTRYASADAKRDTQGGRAVPGVVLGRAGSHSRVARGPRAQCSTAP